MKPEQVKGALEQAAGKVQGVLGELTGDKLTQFEGKARQSAGELQERYGDLLDEWATVLQRRPRTTLFAVAGITLAVVWLFKRRQI
ncbi:CsbD family protein [Pseudomonas typographi]|uniref:CsbD family protein n=1 Tax=Pseudomonas typographi TaxID=2715964 RepID=UPI001689041E|nr:CsbD family protein [Pseudomonas typographi]MBD1553137.1 CsbD family protein [Pseudomonas typographi]MBD1585875.1 CsbD family protein [Pseudomonas typographi]